LEDCEEEESFWKIYLLAVRDSIMLHEIDYNKHRLRLRS